MVTSVGDCERCSNVFEEVTDKQLYKHNFWSWACPVSWHKNASLF